jgi:hypothetical protein
MSACGHTTSKGNQRHLLSLQTMNTYNDAQTTLPSSSRLNAPPAALYMGTALQRCPSRTVAVGKTVQHTIAPQNCCAFQRLSQGACLKGSCPNASAFQPHTLNSMQAPQTTPCITEVHKRPQTLPDPANKQSPMRGMNTTATLINTHSMQTKHSTPIHTNTHMQGSRG